jgi:hypothetical protein
VSRPNGAQLTPGYLVGLCIAAAVLERAQPTLQIGQPIRGQLSK